MSEVQKRLLRAYGALQWALGYLEAIEATSGKHADLTNLAEAISEAQAGLEKAAPNMDCER